MIVHLIASSGFYGAEKVVANICNNFRDKPFTVICLSGASHDISSFQSRSVASGNSDFIRIDNSFFSAIHLLWRLYQSNSLQVLHAHGYKGVFIACFFRMFYRFRLIVTQHGFAERSFKSKVYNLIDKCCCRWGRVDKIVSVSEQIEKIYLDFGVKSNQLVYLPNGVLLKRDCEQNRETDRSHLRKSLGLSRKTPVILFAGRLSEEKDPFLFVSIIELIQKKIPDVHAVIAGDGPMQSALVDVVATLGLTENVTMMGFVTHLEPVLAGADILMLTSLSEGAPMVVLEALATGVPVIASGVGDIPKILSHGGGAVVNSRRAIDYSNSCLEVLRQPELVTQMKARGKETIQKYFDLTLQRDTYLQLYEEGND